MNENYALTVANMISNEEHVYWSRWDCEHGLCMVGFAALWALKNDQVKSAVLAEDKMVEVDNEDVFIWDWGIDFLGIDFKAVFQDEWEPRLETMYEELEIEDFMEELYKEYKKDAKA